MSMATLKLAKGRRGREGGQEETKVRERERERIDGKATPANRCHKARTCVFTRKDGSC